MYLMDPWFLLQPVATGFFSWAVGPLVAQWPKWMQTHPCCVEQRMEDIVSRFMKIKKPEQARRPDYREEQMNAESISARRTTSSVIEQSHIVGRDEELAKVRQFLLSSDGEDARISDDDVDDHLSVMAIVGMGGLGKTTLAQLAYNDDQVNQHFQLKSWVCVSEDFDVIQLTKAMLKSLNVEASGFSELDPLQRKLLQRLKGQGRLLLVLDDVWEADNLNIHGWNLLTAPLRNRSAGTNIIMTTRSRKVPEMVSRNSTYDLSFLSDEDTLELFMLHAFEGRDPNSYLNLVAIGKETARKCKGVPLAAKTLGGLLQTKDEEEWNKILESEIWNTTINQEDSIIPILRLSYRHLPAPLKRCFRYCSLFPKDWVFDKNQIIRMWMAQGYIKTSRGELMEDIGQRYIDNLLSRSFFQTCPSSPKIFLMHDLMHDLARCVSVYECHSMVGGKSCLIPSDIRHLSIIPPRDSRGTIIPTIKDIPEPNFFRSFLLLGIFYLSFLVRESLGNLYTRLEHLRVLDLCGVWFDHLPESIARLKHLRYLRISGFIMKLPECVGSMHHLQTLDLENLGKPYKLPNSMSNLHNLRHITLGSNDTIEYPVGIGKLTDLQTLPGFRVSPNHNHARLGELKDMNNIRGQFAIKGLENLASVNEAKKACLYKKRNISYLCLERNHEVDSSPIDEEVLESLKPSVKLQSLKISGFKGPSYPSWLGDLCFSRLHTIKLEHCGNWASLPPLGQLPSLKSLYVSEAGAVEYIGGEFFSGGFPQLEELTLEDMYNWKSWCGAQEGDCPKLKKLSISSCENLESLSLINLGAVEDISISRCPKLRFMPGHSLELSHLQRAQTIRIQGIYKVWSIEAHFSPAAPSEDEQRLYLEDVGQREAEYMLGLCFHICRLTVRRCLNLTSLPLGNLITLEYVEISECPELRITSVSPQLQQVPSLQKIHNAEHITVLFRESHLQLENVDQLVASFLLKELSHMICRLAITRCANLTSLPLLELTALKYLKISECNQLQLSSGSLQLPQSSSMLKLKIQCKREAEYVRVLFSPGGTEAPETSCLELTNVDKLEALFFLNEFSHMIHRLTITQCANLTSLPLTELTALKYLEISECNQFQLSSGSLQLPQSSSMLEMKIKCICGAEYIRVLFSPGGTEALETSCLELTNVDQLEVLFLLNEFSHMIHRLTITRCANLTSLPWTDLTTIECLTVSECSMFQLLDAKQLPSTLQVLCIYGNPYETEQCGRHQHFQRLKQVQQCSDKEGGERNLYLVFRNVHDASAASKFCSMDFTKIHTLDIEWDCCTNDSSNVTDRVAQEVLFNLYSLCISSQKLVIRGYIDSGFTSWYAICFSKKLRTDFFRSRLSSVSLLQWSKCEILPPLGQVSSLKELYVKGASSLKIFMQDYDDMFEEGWQETQTRIAFPELQKLEFHDMPVWKGWLGTREGDFPRLRKLILKHCPKLRALPHLPPSLEEFELEACDELTSLSASDSPNRTNSLRSSKPFRRLSLSTSKGTSPILQHMSLTNCPLLLAWCEGNPRILVDIPNLLIDGVRVHTNDGNSIRSQIRRIRMIMEGFPVHDED